MNENKTETTERVITNPKEVEKYKIGQRIVVAIYDNKSGTFLDPVFTTGEVNVIRNIQSDLRSETKSMFNQFPADFSIWRLGYFAPDTGEFIPAKEKIIEVEKLVEIKEK